MTVRSAPLEVVVTGATGFVGHACVERLLRAGHRVHALSSRPGPTSLDHPDLTWHQIDLTQTPMVEDFMRETTASHLLHLAWRAVSGNIWSAPDNDDWVEHGRATIESFFRHGGRRVVGSGTCGEYDWSSGVCTEDETPLRPSTRYGEAKVRFWHLVRDLVREDAGRSAAWGRLFFLYGPREHPKRLVASVARALLRDEEAWCSHGLQVRDYLHVDEAADGLVTLLESDAEGAFNIARGSPVSIREIVTTLGEIADKPHLVILGKIPAAPHEPPQIAADPSKTRRVVGWESSLPLAAGLESTYRWWETTLAREEALTRTDHE